MLILFLAIDKERLEAAEAERAITEFSRKKELLMEHRQNLLKEIEQTRHSIQKKRERNSKSLTGIPDNLERSLERRALAAQASKNGPELAFWEEHLAMKLEGVKEDILRIVFSHVYESDWTRECSFTVDLSERDYKGTVHSSYLLMLQSSSVNQC